MGTEHWEAVNTECPCGAGRITVTLRAADHGFAKSYEPSVDNARLVCARCRPKFELQTTQSGNVWLIGKRRKSRKRIYPPTKTMDSGSPASGGGRW